MASIGMIQIVLVLGLLTMPWIGAQAQSSCSNVLLGMAPCLNYVTGSSSTPSTSCCAQLASVVQSKPQCLCSALDGGGSALGININQTLAKALPGACKVQTPPVSQCGAVNGPETSPVGSPQGSEGIPGSPTSSVGIPGSPTSSEGTADSSTSSEGTADSTTSSSVSGFKEVPSNSVASDGNAIAMPLQFVTLFLFVASYASILSSF